MTAWAIREPYDGPATSHIFQMLSLEIFSMHIALRTRRVYFLITTRTTYSSNYALICCQKKTAVRGAVSPKIQGCKLWGLEHYQLPFKKQNLRFCCAILWRSGGFWFRKHLKACKQRLKAQLSYRWLQTGGLLANTIGQISDWQS